MAVSPNLKYAVTQTESKLILWNLSTGKEEWVTWDGSYSEDGFAAFTSDGKTILAKSSIAWKGAEQVLGIRFLDRATGKVVRSFAIGGRGVRACSLSADGKRLLTGGDGPLNLWDIETGKKLQTFREQHGACSLALSRDGKYALSGDLGHPDCSVKLWDMASGKSLWTAQEHSWAVKVVAFSPDSKYVLSAGPKSILNIRRLQDGRLVKAIAVGPEGKEGRLRITSAAFTATGRYIVAQILGQPLQLYEVRSGKVALTLKESLGGMARGALVITPDARHIVGQCLGFGFPVVWDLRNGAKVAPISTSQAR